MIYHITARSTWEEALKKGSYFNPSIETEGFIHCSTEDQVTATANRFYKAQENLVLLTIDPLKVKKEVKYEKATDLQQLFPHIYGELNTDAVVKTEALAPDTNGDFYWIK